MLGYTGYYLCRSNFSVCIPLLIDELGADGMARDTARLRLGEVASLGVLAYAIGKFGNGPLTDFLGGRRAFLSGMALSAACTVGFALAGGLPLFSVAWMANRLFQSMGWPGMVRVTSRWFGWSAYARAMAVVSLSFLFGDAASRWFMGLLIGAGVGWRGVFGTAAAVLAVVWIACSRLLRESPGDVGLDEPEPNPANLFRTRAGSHPGGVAALLGPFLRSPGFWIVCAISLGLTLLREVFNTWTPTYFVEALHFSQGEAARWSGLFPALGGVSVLLAGWFGDRIGAIGRAWIVVAGVGLSVFSLLGLGLFERALGPAGGVALVGFTGFAMLGPYSYLAGVISLDFGGKAGSATACGVIDGVGYLGGVVAGGGVARLVGQVGWDAAFAVLAGVALFTALAGVAFRITLRPWENAAR